MRLLRPLAAALALLALTACSGIDIPDALDTTPEAVAALSCSQAADALDQGNAVLDLYAEVEDAVVIAAPVLDALDIDLTPYSRAVNIAKVEEVVALLSVRVTACG